MKINVAADIANLVGSATGEFSDAFTLWPGTVAATQVYGILELASTTSNETRAPLVDTHTKAHFPSQVVSTLRNGDEILGPAIPGSNNTQLYRVIERQVTPYAVTEVLLREWD